MTGWPDKKLTVVPPSTVAMELAMQVRRCAFNEKHETIPCNMEIICKLGGFRMKRLRFIKSQNDHQALLVPKEDGNFEIIVDPSIQSVGDNGSDVVIPNLELHRLRFRIAHEIGHSFFYDRKVRPPKRIIDSSKQEELFCDYFASVLLVPPLAVEKMPIKASSILKIRKLYSVSAEVAGRSLVRMNPELTVIGLLWKSNPRNENEEMRVVWSDGPKFVPIGARLKSAIVNSMRFRTEASGIEKLNVGGLRGNYSIDVVRPLNGNQVIAVITPTQQSK